MRGAACGAGAACSTRQCLYVSKTAGARQDGAWGEAGWAARLLDYYEGVLAKGEVLPAAAEGLGQGVRLASLPAPVFTSVLAGLP